MKFDVPPEAYDRSVGRYAREIAPRFAAVAGVAALPTGPVLDVGCGPGALTAFLAERFGPAAVAAVDVSERFVAACRERIPGADVRLASAESLPFRDGSFQAALAQLVLSFVPDPPRAVAEMARVVRPGGIVATCTFEGRGFVVARTFWEAATRFDPAAPDDARLPLRRGEELLRLWAGAHLRDVRLETFEVESAYDGFDDLWSMFASGIGPAGVYFLAQAEGRQAEIRDACFAQLGRPAAGFTLPARVIAVSGRV